MCPLPSPAFALSHFVDERMLRQERFTTWLEGPHLLKDTGSWIQSSTDLGPQGQTERDRKIEELQAEKWGERSESASASSYIREKKRCKCKVLQQLRYFHSVFNKLQQQQPKQQSATGNEHWPDCYEKGQVSDVKSHMFMHGGDVWVRKIETHKTLSLL